MRTTLLSSSAWCRGLRRPGGPAVLWGAEPVRLTGTQMDAVAAGTVAVVMDAFATADGSNTYTYTRTSTTVFNTPANTVDIVPGFGTAVACCGSSTDTNVQTSYYAEEDKVIANSTVNDTGTALFSLSNGVTTVIAIARSTFRSCSKAIRAIA